MRAASTEDRVEAFRVAAPARDEALFCYYKSPFVKHGIWLADKCGSLSDMICAPRISQMPPR